MTAKKNVYNKAFRGGPSAVITNMGVFRFDDDGVMYLDTVHPGFSVDDIKENCGFDVNVSRVSGETLPPTYEEIDILYKQIDPEGIFI